MVKRLTYFLDSIIYSYSLLFFSHSKIIGFCLLLTTMLKPEYGIMGLVGVILTNGIASLIGIDKGLIKKGSYGFQGVLLGLSIASLFKFSIGSLIVLAISACMLTLLNLGINNVLYYYFGLTAMTIPFLIVNCILIFASRGIGIPSALPAKNILPDFIISLFPHWINIFFYNLGALTFHPSILAGIIITIGLFIYSRIAFFLVTSGFVFGILLHHILGINSSIIENDYLGHNYMILALAIGGVYMVPCISSYLIMLMVIAFSVMVLSACYYNSFFSIFLFPYALPIIIPLLLALYTLKYRIKPEMWIRFETNDILSPEENIKKYSENKNKYLFSLPFIGKWKVTQGTNDDFTHMFNLQYAYDFQVIDTNENTYKNNGSTLEEYYSFGQPVIAPLDGTVIDIRKNIPDNIIGKINTNEMWGNYVIIQHGIDCYSCLVHFKHNSIIVHVGEYVKRGQVLGFCGNSGKSLRPHIHFQIQHSCKLGAPSIPFYFKDIFIFENNVKKFTEKTKLKKNGIAKNANYISDFIKFFPYMNNNESKYTFNGKNEDWKLSVDYFNNIFLTSSPEVTKLYFDLSHGKLKIKKIEGDKHTGLYLLGSLLTDVHFIQTSDTAVWETPSSKCSSLLNEDEFLIKISPKNGKKPHLRSQFKDAEIIFKKNIGLKSIKIENKEKLTYIAKQ